MPEDSAELAASDNPKQISDWGSNMKPASHRPAKVGVINRNKLERLRLSPQLFMAVFVAIS